MGTSKANPKPSQKTSRPKGKRKNQNDAVPPQKSLPLQLEDDDPDFPRGGGSSLGHEELDGREVDAKFESRDRVLKKRKKTRQQPQRSGPLEEDELGSLFGGGITGKLPKFANKVTLKNVSAGMKLWGVISEVNEKDIVVSLPGGLRGLVRASEAIDPVWDSELDVDNNYLSSIYHAGQLVSCIVLQLDDDKKERGKRKIWLSLRLSLLHKSLNLDVIQEGMVLSAYIKSIEDHGYMLHFGFSNFSGFLSKSDSTSIMSIGQLVQGAVKSIDRTRKVVYLSSDPDMISKCVTKDLKGVSIDLLVPGMLVSVCVRSILENGIMVSFLTYFTGTVDIFNLQESFPTSNWKDKYPQNKKVSARILFLDPSTRAVGLTLNPHLVHNKAPPSLVKIGEIFDQSKVMRVDRGSGLLLEIPSSPVSTPAYVSVTDVADTDVKKLERNFKEGSLVRARILGFRHLEGIATGILKTSAFEGSVFTHSDVKPGMVVKAKIISVDSYGAIVQLAGGVKALCPIRHMSEFEIAKPRKKFQVGADFVFRVLGCKSKRITVTHKKTLVKSKLEILCSYTDASEGLITHGWITKIEDHGCFVRFYNGVQGFAPRSELGLDPGSDISSMYHVEQVVKCRVTSASPASRRINLSFITRPMRVTEEDVVKPGSIVSGVVERVVLDAIVIGVNSKGHLKGTISTEHLSDHYGLAGLMKSLLKPGYKFDQLLVLDTEGSNIVLSAKYSLVNYAKQLPADVAQVRPHSVVHGYVCNLIETGCFVRFIGRLTGFVPRSKATDDRRANISDVFYIGQSVCSNVLDVSSETGRITLSLKQSMCSSTDASFIQEYFLLDYKIAKLQSLDLKETELGWVDGFNLGNVVDGRVHEIKDFGAGISFPGYNDVFGFISKHQLEGVILEAGSKIQAAVLDVSKTGRLVDLSLKPEFVDLSKGESSGVKTSKKKRKREVQKELEVNQTVNALVEIVKEHYLVLSIPAYNFALGYASVTDYNTQKLPRKQFVSGQSVAATVMSLPAPSTDGRLLLLLKSISEVTETSSAKRTKKNSSYNVGSFVQAEITEIKPLELRLKFGSGLHGRVHITETTDDNNVENPFKEFRIGQTLTARIVSKGSRSEHNKWELSIKPSMLEGSGDREECLLDNDFNYSVGQLVSGFVYKVDKDWAWITINRDVNAQLYILDSSCEPVDLEQFQRTFHVGKALSGYVLRSNKDRKLLRIILHPLIAEPDRPDFQEDGQTSLFSGQFPRHIRQGNILGGRITKILPGVGGLLVQIDQSLFGLVHFTELTGAWEPNPLSGYSEGKFVKCKVLELGQSVKGNVQVDLSLREVNSLNSPGQRVDSIENLHPNMIVQGYVKNVTPKGCFVMLSCKIDAKILLSHLSDGYVDNPEKEFPVGKLITGKVVSVEPLSKRVELTCRTSNAIGVSSSDAEAINSLNVGSVISGRIKRIESFGLFISIDQTNLVGLCHISEISDDRVDSTEGKYKTGERVTVKILKVDKVKHRISLGMKSSYFKDNNHNDLNLSRISDYTFEENSAPEGSMKPITQGTSAELGNVDYDFGSGKHPSLLEIESRASIPPLQVQLDDLETSDANDIINQEVENHSDLGASEEMNKKRAKKKAKDEREREIMAAEERLLEKDIPRSADEFEKLVRTSPNSSFVWIKYMAFLLSLADVEKARSIAERALKTINIREEAEKLNVWVAYFNLENEYGNPPQDAVMKVFQRALQFCDPKKVHLALLGMYERTEQHNLANELLDRMVKKFKHSCKVWLRRIQRLLKEGADGVQPVVNRALLCLPRHKHIKFISQAAILEFKSGVPDRGRSMFEGMLREYPKRTDLWSVYLDQEIRLGDVDVIRALFERAVSLSLPPKKMKFLFKKYLEYEKSLGDEARIESVKRKAIEYVESSMA